MSIYEEIELDELVERIDKMLNGRSRGRVLVRHRS